MSTDPIQKCLDNLQARMKQSMVAISELSAGLKDLEATFKKWKEESESSKAESKVEASVPDQKIDPIDLFTQTDHNSTEVPQAKKDFIALHRVQPGKTPIPSEWTKMRFLPFTGDKSIDLSTLFFIGAVMHESVKASKLMASKGSKEFEKVYALHVSVNEEDMVQAKSISAKTGPALDNTRPVSNIAINSYMVRPDKYKSFHVSLNMLFELREFIGKYKANIRARIPKYIKSVTDADISRNKGSLERADCQNVMAGIMRFSIG